MNEPLDKIDHGGEVALSCSCGKDSVASWLYLRERGIKVRPYFFDLCPGLPMTTEALAYYEDFFETPIAVVAHPRFFPWLHAGLHQPEHRIQTIRNIGLPCYTTDDCMRAFAEDFGKPDIWHAVGVRAHDSMTRRAAYAQTKGVVESRRVFWPIAEFRIADVEGILDRHKCKLPRDYDLFGRSFDGLHVGYIKPIRDHSPKDWEVLKFWFPLIETEIMRYELDHEVRPLQNIMKTCQENDFSAMNFDDLNFEGTESVLAGMDEKNTVHEGSKQEVEVLEDELAKSDKRHRANMKIMADGDCNLQVTFQTSAQKQAFLAAMNLTAREGQYVSGITLARMAGVDAQPVQMPKTMKRTIKKNRKDSTL